MTTKSQDKATELSALIRARNPLIWIVTREEARVEGYVLEAAASANYMVRTWDVAQGICNVGDKPDPRLIEGSQDPGATLAGIAERARGKGERCVWIMRDLPPWLQGQPGAAPTRMLRNLARLLPNIEDPNLRQSIVVLSPSGDIPQELAGHATVIEWPLPDREEIEAILDAAIEGLPPELQTQAAPNGQRAAAIDAAVGLTGEEAAACYARSLVQLRRIDPATVANEKRRIITRERVLEWFEPLKGGLDSVGGLDNLKSWLRARASAYSPKAREYGLPAPKGVFLVGIAGCGKSMIAKAIATNWQVPLLKLDLNALKSKFVGESEGNIRKAFKVIEAIGRCVVWIDEIEKALQGATSGSSDGGTSSDALGTFLTWMQERQGESFVIATANDVEALPPELLRKGRFDEVWWVDLPTDTERAAVLASTLRTFQRSEAANIDLAALADACEGFTGSEIAAIVPDAMFTAFNDDARDLTTDDLLAAAKTVVPLSKTAKEKIEKLRQWAVGRARPATSVAATAVQGRKKSVRALDIA